MSTVHVRRKLDSATLTLPELGPLIGETVDITIESHPNGAGDSKMPAPNLAQRFRDLARQWKEATRHTSSTTDMAMHPAYQQIIGMGREVLPILFAEMRRQPDHWFWALKSITGEDSVAPADRGKVRRMTQAWLEWATRQGY